MVWMNMFVDHIEKQGKQKMKWKSVAEERPPVGKQILLARLVQQKLQWFASCVERPFDSSKKYHPDYYYFKSREESKIEYDLTDDMYWLDIDCTLPIPAINIVEPETTTEQPKEDN